MLARFEQYKKCPACNAPRHLSKNAELVSRFFYKFHKYPVVDGRCINLKDYVDDAGQHLSINHLHITCNRCNYQWIEQTALGDIEDDTDYN